MVNASAKMPTTVVKETAVGRPSIEREIRTTIAASLARFPSKAVEAGGDLSDEGVRLIKNGKRTLSTATLFKLARSKGDLGPAVWSAICAICERPDVNLELESPRANMLFGALHMLAQSKGPEAAFAAALLKQMNENESPVAAQQPAAIYDLFEGRRRA